MKYVIYFFAMALLLIINIGFFGILPIHGQIPNLLFLLMLNFALDKKNLDFYFFALLGGIWLDFYSTGFFGAYSLGFLLAGVFTYSLTENFIFLEVNGKSLTLLLLGSLVVFNITLWSFGLTAFKFGWMSIHTPLNIYMDNFFPSFLYNWLLLYPMYLFTNWLKDFIDNFTIRSKGLVR